MLAELHIRNFALIDEISLSFGPGLTVLTGETGAGKSIIIDALQLALGARGSTDSIADGSASLVVEAIFSLSDSRTSACRQLLMELELLDPDEPDTLLLSREIHRSGRSRCRVNGRLVPLGILARLGGTLVDWLGQHEHQSLLQRDVQRRLLDRYGGEEEVHLAAEVERLYQEQKRVQSELGRLRAAEAEREREMDRLRYELREMEEAGLRPGELEELEREERRLRHAERLLTAVTMAYQRLYEGTPEEGRGQAGPGAAAVDLLGEAARELEFAAKVDEELKGVWQAVQQAEEEVAEAARQLRRYRETLAVAPERLEAVARRLDLIRRLARKYGSTAAASTPGAGDPVESILAYRRMAEARLRDLERSDTRAGELESELHRLRRELVERAATLTARRRETAARLAASLPDQLGALALENSRFEIALLPARPEPDAGGGGIGPHGAEQVEFLFSANPGLPPEPLAKVASGGELSRVSLALKAALASADETPVLVFDEVEAGVGGRAVLRLAEVLERLARHHQVLCVTHAPAVAARAHRQLAVEKRVDQGRAHVVVRAVEGEERLAEIVRMLGGERESAAAWEYARGLLARPAEDEADGQEVRKGARKHRSGQN